jgi:hypothetical protein
LSQRKHYKTYFTIIYVCSELAGQETFQCYFIIHYFLVDCSSMHQTNRLSFQQTIIWTSFLIEDYWTRSVSNEKIQICAFVGRVWNNSNSVSTGNWFKHFKNMQPQIQGKSSACKWWTFLCYIGLENVVDSPNLDIMIPWRVEFIANRSSLITNRWSINCLW